MYTRSNIREMLGHHVDGATNQGHPLADPSHPFFPATDAVARYALNAGIDVKKLPEHFDALYDPSHPLANDPATVNLPKAFPGIDKFPERLDGQGGASDSRPVIAAGATPGNGPLSFSGGNRTDPNSSVIGGIGVRESALSQAINARMNRRG